MTTQVKRYQRQNLFTPGVTAWYELELVHNGIVVENCKIGDYCLLRSTILSAIIEDCSDMVFDDDNLPF